MEMPEQDSTPVKLIPLGQDQFAIVDCEDYERVIEHRWYAVKHPKSKVPYVIGTMTGFGGVQVPLHRLILRAFLNRTHIDHRDGNPLNNRKENLRSAHRFKTATTR